MRSLCLIPIVLAAACGFSPNYGEGQLECGPGGACPDDLVCRTDNHCYASTDPLPSGSNDAGTDPTGDGGPGVDPTGDGGVPPTLVKLTVNTAQVSGISGVVSSSVGAISCPGNGCVADFTPGTQVVLTATAGGNELLAGWQGDAKQCNRDATCTVTMDAAKGVRALFTERGTHSWIKPVVGGSGRYELDANGALAFGITAPPSFDLADRHIDGLGGSDILIGKIGAGGEVLWLKQLGGPLDEDAGKIAVAGNGDIIMGGYIYQAELDLGGATKLLNSGPAESQDLFLARFDGATGALKWQRRIPTDDEDEPYFGGIGVDGSGNVFVSVRAYSSVDLGDGTITIGDGDGDQFLAKYDGTTGDLVWKKGLGGPTASCGISDLAVDGNGDVIVGGDFSGTDLDLGNATKPDSVAGSIDGWIAKYSGANGAWIWQAPFGGQGDDRLTSIDITSNNSIYFAGYMQKFGSANVVLYTTTLLGSGIGYEIIAAKLNGATGGLLWGKRYGTSANDFPGEIRSWSGGAALIGSYTVAIQFDAQPILPAPTNTDFFFATLNDSDGAANYSAASGGAGIDYGSNLTARGNNIVLSGRFGGPSALFNTTTIPQRLDLVGPSTQNAFLFSIYR